MWGIVGQSAGPAKWPGKIESHCSTKDTRNCGTDPILSTQTFPRGRDPILSTQRNPRGRELILPTQRIPRGRDRIVSTQRIS